MFFSMIPRDLPYVLPHDRRVCVHACAGAADVVEHVAARGYGAVHDLTYEDLCTRPRATLPALAAFLEAPWPPAYLDAVSRFLRAPHESWRLIRWADVPASHAEPPASDERHAGAAREVGGGSVNADGEALPAGEDGALPRLAVVDALIARLHAHHPRLGLAHYASPVPRL